MNSFLTTLRRNLLQKKAENFMVALQFSARLSAGNANSKYLLRSGGIQG